MIFSILLITLITTQASYVVDNEILLLRSQYLPNNEVIVTNGILDETFWDNSGKYIIEYNDSLRLEIRFLNGNEKIYFAIIVTDTEILNDSVGLFFDTDGDGLLTQPEDAKIVGYEGTTLKASDYYWSGEEWSKDGSSSGTDDDYSVGAKLQDGKLTYEFAIAMVSSNFPYDGFQITNPSGTIIGFSIQIVTSEEKVYYFPTHPNNATGFVDLKLAGSEDQDLVNYLPPEIDTVTETGYYDTVNDAAGMLDFPFYAFFAPIFVFAIIYRRKRHA